MEHSDAIENKAFQPGSRAGNVNKGKRSGLADADVTGYFDETNADDVNAALQTEKFTLDSNRAAREDGEVFIDMAKEDVISDATLSTVEKINDHVFRDYNGAHVTLTNVDVTQAEILNRKAKNKLKAVSNEKTADVFKMAA